MYSLESHVSKNLKKKILFLRIYLRQRKSTNKLNLVHHSLLRINEGRIHNPTKLNVRFDTVTFFLEIVWYCYLFILWSLILFISSTI